MEITDVIGALAATPVWLRKALGELPPALATRPPGPDEWSAADLLAHLRASDAILAPRVFQLLTRPSAPLTGYDERIWARVARRANLPIANQLSGFEIHRGELVGVLRTLTSKEWQLSGLHETRGHLTVRDVATDLASHELEHRSQLDHILAVLGVQAETTAAHLPPAADARNRTRVPRKRTSTRPRTGDVRPSTTSAP